MEHLGHNLKGSAATYGFYGLADIGAKIEVGARTRNDGELQSAILEFKDFVSKL
jgi:hypothetical protein